MNDVYSVYHYYMKTKKNKEAIDEMAPKVIEAADKAVFGNIGDIKYTTRTTVPNGGEWCNGVSYTKTKYPEVYNMLLSGNLQCVDMETYDNVVALNGSCGFFGLDVKGESFKVPLLDDVYIKAGQKASEFGAESLPNITGSLETLTPPVYGSITGTGSFVSTKNGSSSLDSYGATNNYKVDFDASLSSEAYQADAKVNPDHVKYRAYVILYTAFDVKADITKEYKLNNPFSLLDYKWSEYELNNASWLLSNGAFHSGEAYKSAYELLMKIYSGAETKDGVSVKLSTEEYSDTDFVVDTANATFRLPIKVANSPVGGVAPVVGNGRDMYFHSTANSSDGAMWVGGRNVQGTNWNGGFVQVNGQSNSNSGSNLIRLTTDPTKSGMVVDLSQVNNDKLKLYFYVGDTVQDANLINAGKIMEQLAKMDYVVESKVATESDPTWYRVYKSGWVEQGGETNIGIITYPKAFNDTNYNLQVTPHVNQSAQVYWNDFGYDLTTTGFKLRLDNYKTQWRACGQGA